MSTELFAMGLTLVAGLATSIGGLIVLVTKRPGDAFMAVVLGLSAGVMILVSFMELYATAVTDLGFVRASVAFFAGFALLMAADRAIPHRFLAEEPADPRARLLRTGVLTALGLAVHNFPEGLAVFASALTQPELGMAMTLAIAIHNVPEGIAVAAPIYAATNNRWRGFSAAFLSGLAEPAGAVVALLILLPFLTPAVLGYALAFVGGIMVFISLDELLPAAHRYADEDQVILGVAIGMAIMAASLVLLNP